MKRVVFVVAMLALACSGPVVKPSPSPSPSPTPTVSAAGTNPCLVDGKVYCIVNPAVTQATIKQTICVPGWTATVRPPANYTDQLKAQQLVRFASLHQGDSQWTIAGTEEDHRLPLDVGGNPSDPMNLSPQVHRTSTLKDQEEAQLGGSKGLVCQGKMTLLQAQQKMVADWLGPWPAYKK